MKISKYSIELYDRDGTQLADLSAMAKGRSITQSRNQPEDIRWNINLDEWEAYCRSINVGPLDLVIPKRTEVRVRRGGNYICGGQVIYARPRLSNNDQVFEIRATGYLNMFARRYTGTTSSGTVQEAFPSSTRATVAWQLLAQSQALTNGDLGISMGPNMFYNMNHEQNYDRTNIKEALQDMTKLKDDPIDFEFTYDKKFNTYKQMGSKRPDIIFNFPGNIKSIDLPYDGTEIINEVVAIGQGDLTHPALELDDHDTPSGIAYKLQQDIIHSNAVDNSDGGMTNAINAILDEASEPIQIPEVEVDGNVYPFVTDYGIGDTVIVKVANYKSFAVVNGEWRVESRQIDIDEDDNENVTLGISLPSNANLARKGLKYRVENMLAGMQRQLRDMR